MYQNHEGVKTKKQAKVINGQKSLKVKHRTETQNRNYKHITLQKTLSEPNIGFQSTFLHFSQPSHHFPEQRCVGVLRLVGSGAVPPWCCEIAGL